LIVALLYLAAIVTRLAASKTEEAKEQPATT
jgi:hypothetical protein